MYSLGLKIAPCIRFTLVKSRFKNIWCFKQAVSRCKMAGAGFHSIAKLRAQMFNPVLADRGVPLADCQNENGLTADCQSQESEFESRITKAWNARRVRIRPQSGSWQSAVQLIADCQAVILIVAFRGVRARSLAKEWNPPPPFYIKRPPVWNVVFIWSATLQV
jgi:hypothetical protein